MYNDRRKTVIIGVTGGFGTGKTTVAKAFKRLGAVLIDADTIAHQTLKKGTPAYRKVVKVFGPSILGKGSSIDRAKLGKEAFSNKRALKRLCDITHPVILREITQSIRALVRTGKTPAIVIDAPLLIEANLHAITDYLVVVTTSRATQLKRIFRKTGLDKREANKRIQCQIPLRKKVAMADYIIDNEGSKQKVNNIVKKIWKEIKSGADE